MEKEIWKDVKGYEGVYKISNLGKVKSLKRKRVLNDRLIKPAIGKRGYFVAVLSKNGIVRSKYLHRLIAIAFIENPNNKYCVNHINGIKTDNSISNLEWVTYKENNFHARKTGLCKQEGEMSYNSKLKNEDVIEIRKLSKTKTHGEIALIYKVSRGHIGDIVNRVCWKHI